ncbi:MAG: LamG domain-containing protein [Kiritimatiellae bacterium]|nr:LamG domain-containing protein [Kiritimatiellia bacterium]
MTTANAIEQDVRIDSRPGDITTGLVSHWPMDEESGDVARDIVSGNDGRPERGTPERVPGKVGKGALRFAGNCYLNCGRHESLAMTNAMTFAAWLKKPADGRKSRIASKHGFVDQKNGGWLILFGGPKKINIEWQISTNGENWNGGWTAPGSFPYDEWHHLAVTYDGTAMRAYIDGIESTDADFPHRVSGPIHVADAETLLGQDRAHGQIFGGPATWSLTGCMDDARLYNRALSPADVAALLRV